MNRCIINIKALADSNEQNAKLHLDNAFFESFNSSEILGGSVDVLLFCQKTSENDTYSIHMDINGDVVVPCTRCLEDMIYRIELSDDIKVYINRDQAGEELEFQTALNNGDYDASNRIFETISLNIPMVHYHLEGQCNKEMINKLVEHSMGETNEITN